MSTCRHENSCHYTLCFQCMLLSGELYLEVVIAAFPIARSSLLKQAEHVSSVIAL